jgi:hypothetical protein
MVEHLGSKLVVRPRVAEASGGGCVPEVSPSRQHTRRHLTTTTTKYKYVCTQVLGHSLKSGNFTFSGFRTGIQSLKVYLREFETPVMFHRSIFSEVETS